MLALSTTDLNMGLTPTDLVQSLIASGLTISNVSFTGDNSAGAQFMGGVSEGLNVESGVILSSGNVADAAGPNDSENITTSFNLPGDPDLDGLIPGFETFDATVLEFDFVGAGGTISFQYVFGSEEYNEFVGSSFNDVFGFFLDGQNIALIPGTSTPVSINNVNAQQNSQYYNNNSPADLGTPTPFLTQADGFTVLLTATADITPGTHHIKLAVADAGDTALDSWVFLAGESFISGDVDMEITKSDSPDPVIVDNPLTYSLLVTNHGPDPASGIVVQDMLPAGVTFVEASSSQGAVVELNGVVTAELDALDAGESATVTITVIPHELGTITNTATVEALQNETNPENNTAVQVTTVDTPKLFVNDVQVIEGNVGTKDAVFTISLNAPDLNHTITVDFVTVGLTADSGIDFLPRVGKVTFAPGVGTRPLTIPIIGDRFNEPAETFLVQLTNAANADIVDGLGTGTILDDDPLPNFYVSDVQLTSTSAGLLAAVFTVALDVPSGRQVTVGYSTSDGSATNGVDYFGQSGMLTFAPGVTTRLVSIPVLASADYSSNKKFFLNLTDPVNALTVDPQGAATMVYAPEPQNDFIIDDGALGYTQSPGWTNVTNTLAYQLDYDYAAAGSGHATASWTFTDIPNGPYQVFARWIPFVNRATNAPYTISNGTTTLDTVLVNQQTTPNDDQSNGVTWHSLGTFEATFETLSVQLTNAANGYVIADAIRIVRGGIGPQVPEMDVSGFDHSVNTGDMTPALEDATDFGPVPLLIDSQAHLFMVSNNGNADLHLTGNPAVTISGANAGDFILLTQPSAVVAPGKATAFSIVFHPTGPGLRTAVVSIANDDDTEHPYTFAVQGTGSEAAPPPAAVPHNAAWPEDVNADNRVSPSDALILVNQILSQTQTQTAAPSAAPLAAPAAASATPTYYVDVNGDGRVSPSDLLQVVNYLLSPPVTAPAAAPAAEGVDAVASALGAPGEESSDEAPPAFAEDTTAEAAAAASPSEEPPLLLSPASVEAVLEADESSELPVEAADLDPLLAALVD